MNKSVYIALVILLAAYLITSFFYFQGDSEIEPKIFSNNSIKDSLTKTYSPVIPLIQLDGWETSNYISNPEDCHQESFFVEERLIYCNLSGLTDSFSVYWNKEDNTEKSRDKLIIASAFEFSNESFATSDNVMRTYLFPRIFLEDFTLEDVTIKRYKIVYESITESIAVWAGSINESVETEVSFFDVFSFNNAVFTVFYNENYKNEAEIIEKAIIEKNKMSI